MRALQKRAYILSMHKIYFIYLKLKLSRIKAFVYDKILGIEASEIFAHGKKNNNSGQEVYGYQPSPYGRLEKMVRFLNLSPDDIFTDLGCGKGRVVFFMGLQKLKKVIGLEIDTNLYAVARNNLRNLRINRSPIEIFNIDAVNFNFREVTIFFMFNPFGSDTLEIVLNNIKNSLISEPRFIRIIYYGSRYSFLLDKQGWLARTGEIENNHCLVWHNIEYVACSSA
jgi:SAM-dependent methyltransferase